MATNHPPRLRLTRRALLGGTAALGTLPALGLGGPVRAETPQGGLAVLRDDAILRPLPRGAEGPPQVGISGERVPFAVRDPAGGAPVAFRPAPG